MVAEVALELGDDGGGLGDVGGLAGDAEGAVARGEVDVQQFAQDLEVAVGVAEEGGGVDGGVDGEVEVQSRFPRIFTKESYRF